MAVTKLLITSRRPFAQEKAFGQVGPYEQLDGTVSFAVDPTHPANQLITDLKLAPRDVSGRVHFSADWRILRPVEPQRGNHRLLFDILNRGRGPGLRNLNSAQDVAPTEPLDPGNGFLMRQGYTVAWCGWQHDVPDAPGLIRLRAPEALTPEGPISGKIMVTFQPTTSACVQFLADRLHRPYPTHNLDDRDAMLTEQEHEDAPERIIPREQWSFARLENGCVVPDASHVYMASGFVPGKVYQVIYTTTGAPIVGCGLLATRDMGSFLKYGTAREGNPCAGDLQYAYSFGVSQSGRFLRHFLYLGLNQDEQDRTVFDGLIPHVAGGKHGEFNHRFAQPSSQASRSPNNVFPYSDVEQTDPETGRTAGLLSRLAAQGKMPKVMHTYTSSEYWGGHGALVHIDVTGSRDLEVPESVRIYHFGGTQHPVGTFPPQDIDPRQGYAASIPSTGPIIGPCCAPRWSTWTAGLRTGSQRRPVAIPASTMARRCFRSSSPLPSVPFLESTCHSPCDASSALTLGHRQASPRMCRQCLGNPTRGWCRPLTRTAMKSVGFACPSRPCPWRPTPAGIYAILTSVVLARPWPPVGRLAVP